MTIERVMAIAAFLAVAAVILTDAEGFVTWLF
jgi:hypothetical protein